MPETDEEFQQRLAEKYAEPTMLHREMLYLSRDRFDILRSELWERLELRFWPNTTSRLRYSTGCAGASNHLRSERRLTATNTQLTDLSILLLEVGLTLAKNRSPNARQHES